MKYAKKIMAACAATALLATMATTSVFAEDVTNVNTTPTQTTKVTYSVTAGYTWTVPADVSFDKDKGVNATVLGTTTDNKVSVTNNVIPEGQKLQITAKGSGTSDAFVVKNTSGKEELTYEVKHDSTVVNANDVVLEVASGTASGDVALTFTLSTKESGSEIAGTYEGTVTYTASVVDQ